jgi:DNA-binding MarR family transcriptional regulator
MDSSGGKQGELFGSEGAYARRNDPGTSHNAAQSIRGTRVTELEGQVLDVLKAHGKLTAFEIAKLGDMEYGSTSPRLKQLELKGKVRRLDPEARNGRKPSIVWEAIVWTP